MVKEGFTIANATRAYSLLYSFTVGFCIEEQASAQAAAIGDDRFSEASHAARLDARSHPLLAEGGPQIFGDPDARFTDLVTLIIATAARLRA